MSPPGTRYRNAGNADLLAAVPRNGGRVLDIGCGAGDNARLLRQRGHAVIGVTSSPAEAEVAAPDLDAVIVADVESGPLDLGASSFDVILLSHVLEHLRDPAAVLNRMAPLLTPGGLAIVAVPNMANWRLRLQFLKGDWRRPDTGPLDRTHLQFWSFRTAPSIVEGTLFRLAKHRGGGYGVPFWPVRRLFPRLGRWVDSVVGPRAPNLFASQCILVLRRAE